MLQESILIHGKRIPRAWIVCWELDERHVLIREGGTREGRERWVPVRFDEAERYFYCEVGGVKFFLCTE